MITTTFFSIYNYKQLSDYQRLDFNKSLAKQLSSVLTKIKADDVLGTIGIGDFVASESVGYNSVALVADLYSKASAGVQVGIGNQNLYLNILNAFTECWEEINKQK